MSTGRRAREAAYRYTEQQRGGHDHGVGTEPLTPSRHERRARDRARAERRQENAVLGRRPTEGAIDEGWQERPERARKEQRREGPYEHRAQRRRVAHVAEASSQREVWLHLPGVGGIDAEPVVRA